MMNIIAASRLRGQTALEPNTFIGGIGALYLNKTDLATLLNLQESDISLFSNDGTDIKCNISVNYVLSNNFNNSNLPITYYFDLEGKVTVTDQSFRQDNQDFDKLKFVYLPNAQIGDVTFRNRGNKNNLLINIPSSNPIGSTVGIDLVFNNTLNTGNGAINYEVYCDIVNQTSNSGSPDGDLQKIISDGSTVFYRDSNDINQTTSSPAATISTNVIGGTFVELNVSKPTHVNTLKYALVFVDVFFQDVYDINSDIYALILQEQTSYDIKVIIADEYFNISPYSNTINVTTTTIDTAALFQNGVAYYKQNELSGQALDLINTYNGVDVGIIVKDGEWYDYGTNESYVEIADNDDFSFTNGISATDFVIKTEVIFDGFNSQTRAWLVSKRESLTAGVQGWQLILFSGNLEFSIWDDSNSETKINTPFSPITGQKYILGVTYINNELRLFVDGVTVATDPVASGVTFANTSSVIKLGNETFTTNLNLVGRQKETVFIKGKGWTDGEISDNYNNGDGTTI